MYKLVFVILLTFISIIQVFSQNQLDTIDNRLAGLDIEIEEVMKTWNLPGVAIAIVEKDQIIYEQAFGYRDLEKKLPVTTTTLFPIASNTKSFTASLIGILVADDQLALTDRPQKWLPTLSFFQNEAYSSIMIKDLMAHKSGLPAHNMSLILFPPTNRNDIVSRIQYLNSSFKLRDSFTYSNMLYSILGIIIEAGTQNKWEKEIQDKLFTPLEMEYSTTSIEAFRASPNYALGYDSDLDWKQTSLFHYTGWEPGGGINSNVHEMGNWLITWINGGQFKEQQVIPAAFVSDALSIQTIISSNVPRKTGSNFFTAYGYGWMLQNYYGHYRAHHQGGARGYNAMTSIFPNDSVGIVVLTNEYGSWTNSIIRDLISNRMLGLEQTDLNQLYWNAYQRQQSRRENVNDPKPVQKQKKSGTEIQKHQGIYTNLGYGQIKIMYEDGELKAVFPKNKFILHPIENNTFRMSGINQADKDLIYYMTTHDTPPEINFVPNEKGESKMITMKLEPQLDALIEFRRE